MSFNWCDCNRPDCTLNHESRVNDLRPDRSAPLPEYEEFRTVLDRILVQRVPPEKVDDGFEIPEKFRQSENWGTVLVVGDCVVLGQQRFPLTDFVNVGDLVKYGEHTAENFSVQAPDKFLIRLQDVRGVRRLKRG